MSGLIAIVGRPNVGKSALFNRIVGKRIAIVHDMPGVTRDRVTAQGEFRGRAFTLVDTGGIGLLRNEKSSDVITAAALDQVEIAIESAQVIILVVNVQEGVVPLDIEAARRLRRVNRPVLVAVNKSDHGGFESGMAEFARLGFDQLFPVSAIHNRGVESLLEAAVKLLPFEEAPAVEEQEERKKEAKEDGVAGPMKIAIVGRPNVGKSSIINALTGSERVVVSPVPGTTRDAVDVPFTVDAEGLKQEYVLIDTAGLRKARRVDDTVEYFSVQRTEEAVKRCELAVLVLDAQSGILEQDKKIGGLITEHNKACVVVVNKWDLFEENVREKRKAEVARRERGDRRSAPNVKTTLQEFGEWVQEKLFFLDYAPVIFTSAKSGFHLDKLLEAIRYVGDQLKQKIPTAILNRTLRDAIEVRQPISDQGHFLKFYYATQVRQSPPTFLLFVNKGELFSAPYLKHLSGQMRKAFGYEGCPIVIVPRARPKTVDSIRKVRTQDSRKRQRPAKGRKPFEKSRPARPGPGHRR